MCSDSGDRLHLLTSTLAVKNSLLCPRILAALQVLNCCVHALGGADEEMLLSVVQPLDRLLASDPASSLEVMTTAVGYMAQGWARLPEKLGSTLCLVAKAILPQLQVSLSTGKSLWS